MEWVAVDGDQFPDPRGRVPNSNFTGEYWDVMNWRDHIILDATVLAGKPVVRGTRLAVDFIVGLLGQGWTEPDIFRNYPDITHDDIAACLQYASEILESEKVYPAAIA